MCASQKQNYGPIFDLELMQITPMYSPDSLILKPIATKNELKRFPAWNYIINQLTNNIIIMNGVENPEKQVQMVGWISQLDFCKTKLH